MNNRRKPLHPGVMFKNILKRREITQQKAADMLKINRKTVSEFCNTKTRCSVEMAARLARALDMNSAAWINMQANFDAWEADNMQVAVDKFPSELEQAS